MWSDRLLRLSALILEPDTFFRERQEKQIDLSQSITFLVVCAAILGALRFTFTPLYPDTIPWFGWVMSDILAVPITIYAAAINSLLVQVILSLSLQRERARQFSQVSADYRRTVTVFCYAALFPALLLWIPSFTTILFLAVPVIILIAAYTTYIVLTGLSRYHDLPLVEALRHGDRYTTEQVSVARLLAGSLLILFTLEFVMITLPLALS